MGHRHWMSARSAVALAALLAGASPLSAETAARDLPNLDLYDQAAPQTEPAAPVAPLDAVLPLDWAAPEIAAADKASPEPTASPETVIPLEWAAPALDGVIADEKLRGALSAIFSSGAASGPWDQAGFETLAAFYGARDYRPLWSSEGHLSDQAKAAITRISRAADDGLDPAAFHVPTVGAMDIEAMARAEVDLSLAVIAYAAQAQSGRVDPGSISPMVTAKPERPDPAYVLGEVSAADDAAARLDAFNPPHEGFKALRGKLAELRRAAKAEPLPRIAAGPLLKPGMSDWRVPLLRTRLGVPAMPDQVYDAGLVEAVRAFQRSRDLRDEAVIGKLTLDAMNDETEGNALADVLVNMERWRWLPRDLGRTHVFVNIPEFHADVMHDGRSVHETRVIVGSVTNQTPIFSNTIQFLIVNPYWHVPYSIASKEMLPKLQQDPTYLARQGIEVVYVRGGRRQVLDSTAIDWSNISLKGLHFRQPPGERNALGHIKFMFPNEHSVYLHDTPTRNLFGRTNRALSHGCVRVEDPFALAEILLGVQNGWTKDKVKRLVGGAERRINLPEAVPVHLTYFTSFVDGAGNLKKLNDIYGHDRRMRSALGLELMASR